MKKTTNKIPDTAQTRVETGDQGDDLILSPLRQKELLLQTIFDALPEATIFVDSNRKIIMANPAVEKVIGYKPAELLGRTTSMFYANQEDYLEQGRLRYNKAQKQAGAPYHVNYRRKNGEVFPSETIGAPIIGEKGETLGHLGIIRDITEELKHREFRLRTNEELEKRVVKRTDELRMLTRAISHDIRSPMVAISGFANLTKRQLQAGNTEKAAEYADRISDAVDWVQTLLNDLSELLKASETEHHITRVNLHSIASKVADVTQGLACSAGVRIIVPQTMPTIEGNQTQLRRIFENLIHNACKFKREEVDSFLKIEVEEDPDQVTIRLIDNGIGVEEEHQNSIFRPFVRLSSEIEGSGMGLAIVRRFIEIHGGKIWVESEGENKGATFIFTLPRSRRGREPG